MSTPDARGHLSPQTLVPLRIPVPEALAARVRWAWVPRWCLPTGTRLHQQVLEFPGGNLVVEPAGQALHLPAAGLSVRELTGTGWAVGLLLQPGCGAALAARDSAPEASAGLAAEPAPEASAGLAADSAPEATGTEVPAGGSVRTLTGELGASFAAVAASVRTRMAAGHLDDSSCRQAAALLIDWAADQLPEPDATGRLLTAICARVDADPAITSSSALAAALGIGQRRLQRIVSAGLGFSPTWLIRRRRLQEAAARIRAGVPSAQLAAELGYSDQAHFQRDFRAVTGQTPGAYRRIHED